MVPCPFLVIAITYHKGRRAPSPPCGAPGLHGSLLLFWREARWNAKDLCFAGLWRSMGIPPFLLFLKIGPNLLGPVACLLQRMDDLQLMLGPEGLHRNFQLHGGVAVGAEKLIVVQLDDVSVLLGDHA